MAKKGGQLSKIEEIYKGTYKWFKYNTFGGPTTDGTRDARGCKDLLSQSLVHVSCVERRGKSNLLSKGHDDGTYK